MPTDQNFNTGSNEISQELHTEERYTALIENHATQLVDNLFQDFESDLSGLTSKTARRSHSIIQTDRGQANTESSAVLAHPSSILLSLPAAEAEIIPYVPFEAALLELEANNNTAAQPERLLPVGQENTTQGFNRWALSIGLTAFVCSIGVWVSAALQHSTPVSSVAQTVTPQQPQSAQPSASPIASAQQPTQPPATAVLPSPVNIPLRSKASPFDAVVQPNTPTQNVALASSTMKTPTAKDVKNSAPGPTPKVTAPAKGNPPPAAAVIPVKAIPTALATASIPFRPSQQSLPTLTHNATPEPLPMGKPSGKPQLSGITIQGTLPLGEQSTLLLARNGSSQQVRIGEVLDESGWRLVRVENDGRAVIQRGDEIRTVSVGEKF